MVLLFLLATQMDAMVLALLVLLVCALRTYGSFIVAGGLYQHCTNTAESIYQQKPNPSDLLGIGLLRYMVYVLRYHSRDPWPRKTSRPKNMCGFNCAQISLDGVL